MIRARVFVVLAAAIFGSFGADAPEPTPGFAPPETFRREQTEHWAFRRPTRPTPPEVREAGWVRNPIDRFILAGLESDGYPHAPEADKGSLIRRLTFDLTGLPPTPEQVAAFRADDRPDAYDRLVDRLLASRQFGERWAQHWLDLAHYADSNGFELDAERPDAWRYRDWVVDALNADMPYDRFVAMQIAGDEVAPGDRAGLIATGFGRCGPREVVSGNIDPAVKRQSELTEITGTVGSVFLGLTMACARCHDHKFDALPTTDYYRLQSFFAGAELVDEPIATPAEEASHAEAKKAEAAALAPIRAGLAKLEAPYRKSLGEAKQAGLTPAERDVLAVPEAQRTAEQKKLAMGATAALKISWEEVAEAVAADPEVRIERERLKRAAHEVEIKLPPPPPRAMALVDRGQEGPPETFVHRRGEPKNRGPKVAPRPPGVLLATQPEGAYNDPQAGRRKALADWLARPDNPLTARVIVNRLWMHHVGRGIVATPSDFGVRGDEPSHPELLDWLAAELVEGGWSLKRIHRLIVTSAAYRQASAAAPASAQLREDDPDNVLVGRMARRRLDAEGMRDAMLAASGELNGQAGGPGVRPPIEPEVEALIFTEAEVVDLWVETPDPLEHARRSLYLFRKRNVRYPLFDAFDAPDTQTACPQRATSVHALQPLVLLNGDFALGRARALVARLACEAGPSVNARVALAYEICLARESRPAEREQARAFLDGQAEALRRSHAGGSQPLVDAPDGSDPAEHAAWVDFALAMLNRNEFAYVP